MKLRISVIEGLVRRYCGFTQDIRLIFGRDVPFCLGDSDHLSLVLNRVRHLTRLWIRSHDDPVAGLQSSIPYQTYIHTYDSLECLHGTTSRNSNSILGESRRKDVSLAFSSIGDINRPYLFLATLAVQRLQAIITTFLLRRMKDSKLDGKRLIELPEKNVGMVQLEFSPEERDVYKMVIVQCVQSKSLLILWKQVEIRSQARFNKFLRAGTVLKYEISLETSVSLIALDRKSVV